MRPKTPQEYLLQTEHAVRHLYEGIASCGAYYQQAASAVLFVDCYVYNFNILPRTEIASKSRSKVQFATADVASNIAANLHYD